MTFVDSEIPGLLDEPDDLETLLSTCVSVPSTPRALVAGGEAQSRSVWSCSPLGGRMAIVLVTGTGQGRRIVHIIWSYTWDEVLVGQGG